VKQQTLPIKDWLLTETVRLREEREGRSRDDEAANALARTAQGALGQRLATRAAALPGADGIRVDIRRLFRLVRNLSLLVLVLATVVGMLAARASIAQRHVDILLATATLLALPTLMLVLWVVLMLSGRKQGGSGSLSGHLVRRALGWLGPKLLTGEHAVEVTLAGGRALGTGFGRWLLSALAHAFWSVYLLSALAALTFFFSVAQYDLIWGTTLLTDETVVGLVRTMAAPPAWLGLIPPPEAQWILGGREGDLLPEARALWAQFLMAMVLVYGLLPRLILLLACGLMAGLSGRRLVLNISMPGYLRLSRTLRDPREQAIEHGQAPATSPVRRRQRPAKSAGEAVLIGLELENENNDWPPTIPGIPTRNIDHASDRAGKASILAALEALPAPSPVLLVCCSMLRTPDAAAERFINDAADRARTLPVLILLEADRLIERGGRIPSRLADWEALAERVGGEAFPYDVETPEAATIARLRQISSGDSS
jgi:hypothetical protein